MLYRTQFIKPIRWCRRTQQWCISLHMPSTRAHYSTLCSKLGRVWTIPTVNLGWFDPLQRAGSCSSSYPSEGRVLRWSKGAEQERLSLALSQGVCAGEPGMKASLEHSTRSQWCIVCRQAVQQQQRQMDCGGMGEGRVSERVLVHYLLSHLTVSGSGSSGAHGILNRLVICKAEW